MLHIYTGRDHISFVLALLLVVVIGRRGGATASASASATMTPTATPAATRLTTVITACTAAAIWIGLVRSNLFADREVIAFAAILVIAIGVSARRIAKPMIAWQLRPLWPTLRATATVITAFTIAHSLTLIAASLGWLHLPSRFVEAMIAVSIAYTAIEDIIKPDVRWRYVLTFGFGLIHGLGFASVLAELLPPGQVVAPLLEFNVGVELGQLSIVAVALPLFALVARLVGADRYRARVLPALATAIAALAAIWIVERVLGIVILGL
jgi:hypothetical protein